MNIKVLTQDDDDPEWVELINQVLLRLLAQDAPAEAVVVRIDRWFDHKWLKFSGIGRVYFDNALRIGAADVALDEFHQDKVTFPPFTPNRVREEQHFFRVGDDYFESVPDKFVHRSSPISSSTNLQKRVVNFSSSGIFIWFDSQSQRSRHGSLMVYEVSDGQVHIWFASFEKSDKWNLRQVKGSTREHILALVN